jgi:hypothetical protein
MTAQHCMMALLFSETNPDDNDRPLDCGDWEPSPELESAMEWDWDRFRTMAEAIGFDPAEALAVALHPDCEGDPWNQAAHDFILTRNGHGAGFWDGHWHAPWGDRLTALAKQFVEIHPYVGEDGMIYPD